VLKIGQGELIAAFFHPGLHQGPGSPFVHILIAMPFLHPPLGIPQTGEHPGMSGVVVYPGADPGPFGNG